MGDNINNAQQQLHACVRNNKWSEMAPMLQNGVDINCVCYGMTPLMVAIDKGHVDIAVQLIKRGCDINLRDSQSTISPFQMAVTNNLVQVVKTLIGAGADPNEPIPVGHTPLTYAVSKKFTDLMQMLIDCQSYVNAANASGLTPLYLCARDGCAEAARRLMAAGAHRNETCTADANTPLIAAVLNERTNVVSVLLKAGVDVNAQDSQGWTALHHAVCDGNEALVKMLLAAGARKDVQNRDGLTPLNEAQENDLENIVELLTKL